MSSNGEFSTMSSGEVPSLPSSREATAENGCGSAGVYVPLGDFLDRFSLPRVVRIEASTGRPVLLYKQQQRSLRVTASLILHRYRHDAKVGPQIVIPEGYPGWFSVISGNGTTCSARVYRSVETLVRAGVSAFLLAAPLRAYILTHSKMENGNLRAHYTKTTIRAGEVLRLVAIFQNSRRCGSMSFSIASSSSEHDQYAQCLDPYGCEMFAPLSARGEFYAVSQSDGLDQSSDAVLYKVHQLVRRQLPLRVRLIAGPLPVPLPREYAGLMQLESVSHGPIVLGCLVPETPVYSPQMLELLVSGSGAPRVRRTRLGYPSEVRLLASPKMQRLLSSCSQAVGDRATEPRVAAQKQRSDEDDLKKIKPMPENKTVLRNLREGFGNLKMPVASIGGASANVSGTGRNTNSGPESGTAGLVGFLERISKLRQPTHNRNPAKKSASFTFAVRPEIAMKAVTHHKYCSLEPAEQQQQQLGGAKQLVQRSVSTSMLEVPSAVEFRSEYSRVRDSLAPLPILAARGQLQSRVVYAATKPDEIYAEVCENPSPAKCPAPTSQLMASIKIFVKDKRPSSPSRQELTRPFNLDKKYVNTIFVTSPSPSHGHSQRIDTLIASQDDGIYNTIF